MTPEESQLVPKPGLDGGLKHNPLKALRQIAVRADGGETLVPAPHAAPRTSGLPVLHGRLTVRRERAGRGGKTVTLVEGPGLDGRDLAKLAREAARDLGVGARVEGRALVVQGDQAERLVAWLASRGFAEVVRGN
jgi:translation initiation factor 1